MAKVVRFHNLVVLKFFVSRSSQAMSRGLERFVCGCRQSG
ncbi:MAG: hypothetical protein QOH85_2141 [Acidobacteriaceae bacterium]|jgi:hypothetical protein|nr:hypothetical protein [Acidobacteriaceae bacterium]